MTAGMCGRSVVETSRAPAAVSIEGKLLDKPCSWVEGGGGGKKYEDGRWWILVVAMQFDLKRGARAAFCASHSALVQRDFTSVECGAVQGEQITGQGWS